MSGVVNKVKEALSGEWHHPEASQAADSTNTSSDSNSEPTTQGSHVSRRNPSIVQRLGLDGLRKAGSATSSSNIESANTISGSVGDDGAKEDMAADSDRHRDVSLEAVSATNPGIVNSTTRGIHGLRDTGTGITPGFEEVERKARELRRTKEAPATGAPDEATGSSSPSIYAGSLDQSKGSEFGTTTTIVGGAAARVDTKGDFAPGSGYDGKEISQASQRDPSGSEPGSGLTSGDQNHDPSNTAPGTGYIGPGKA